MAMQTTSGYIGHVEGLWCENKLCSRCYAAPAEKRIAELEDANATLQCSEFDWTQRAKRAEAEVEKLRDVIEWASQEAWWSCDIDGGLWQDKLESLGLLVEVPASAEIKEEFETETMFVVKWSPLADAAREGEG